MTFATIPSGAAVFLDANTLVYHFSVHPVFGPPSTDLVERIENREVNGFTSADVVSDVAHRLMTVEAIGQFGWVATDRLVHIVATGS